MKQIFQSFRSLKKIDSLLSNFEKDWPRSNRSRQFLKKIDRVEIDPVTSLKKTGAIRSFSWLNDLSFFQSQKTIDSVKKPMMEFPTLGILQYQWIFHLKILNNSMRCIKITLSQSNKKLAVKLDWHTMWPFYVQSIDS